MCLYLYEKPMMVSLSWQTLLQFDAIGWCHVKPKQHNMVLVHKHLNTYVCISYQVKAHISIHADSHTISHIFLYIRVLTHKHIAICEFPIYVCVIYTMVPSISITLTLFPVYRTLRQRIRESTPKCANIYVGASASCIKFHKHAPTHTLIHILAV